MAEKKDGAEALALYLTSPRETQKSNTHTQLIEQQHHTQLTFLLEKQNAIVAAVFLRL